MKEELLKYFGPREEPIVLAGHACIVRTLGDDHAPFVSGADTLFQFAVRCTFDEAGEPVFTDEDIPVLKAAPSVLTLPLFRAVERVNGFDAAGEVKNSEAAPSSG